MMDEAQATVTDFSLGNPPISRPSGLVDEVFQRIRADIMSLKIPPDTRIPVDSLVRTLGVSQTPIREALSMLEAIGLVSKRHFVGYCTAPRMTRKALDEMFEIRLLLEPFAARRAAEKMDKAAQGRLEALAGDMAAHQAGPAPASYEAFADHDAEFHQLIAAGGENALIAQSLERLHTHLHIFRLCSDQEIADEAIGEHARVVAAIAAADVAGAEEAMRVHIKNSYVRLSRHIES